MSRKRRNTSSAEPDSPVSKRFQPSTRGDSGEKSSENNIRPQVNALTGLTSAFPGLADNTNLFYGPARDGLDYLRMVRTEAQSIPSFLSAPGVHHAEPKEEEDYEGFFNDDEAIIAAPVVPKDAIGGMSKAQKQYYESVMEQYEAMRLILNSTPPLSAVQLLPESIPISFPANSRVARSTWEAFIMTNPANPVQVASMEADSVQELIRLITKKMRRFMHSSKEEDVRRMGTWIWAMLARCPDRGQLSSEEISDLRGCAKAAAMTRDWLQSRTEGAGADLQAEEDTDEEGSVSGDVIQNANKQILSSDIHPELSNGASRLVRAESASHSGQSIILDMIITILGEAYGQRDLLELRIPWALADGG